MTFPQQQFQPQFGQQPVQQFGQPMQQGAPLPQFPQPTQAAPQQNLQSANDFLAGGGKSFNFGNAQLGFKRLQKPFGGVIVSDPVVSQVTNFTTKQPEFWPDGRPREQLMVTIDTLQGPYPEREDADDDGKRTLYVKGSMVNPFRQAVQKGNGGRGALEVGGLLLGCHTGTNGQAYTWAFEYTPPGQQAPTAPQPPAAPAQQAQPMSPGAMASAGQMTPAQAVQAYQAAVQPNQQAPTALPPVGTPAVAAPTPVQTVANPNPFAQ